MTSRTLFPYQEEGVEFLIQPRRNPNVALFDLPGIGKTAQAIVACDRINAQRLIVICPAVARVNWQRELDGWQSIPRKVFIIKTSTKPIPADADVLIMSQDAVASDKIREMIFDLPLFDVLIVDECHGFKSPEALRTKGLYGPRLNKNGGLVSHVGRTILLSGTPTPNNSSELFPHLRALAPERLESPLGRYTRTQFLHQFCTVKNLNFGMKTVTKVTGNRNNAELRERLKGFYLRRKKEDVIKDLPPLHWGTVVLEPPKDALKTLKQVENDPRLKELYSILAAASLAHHNKDDQAADEILASANKEAISALRHAVGLAKVKPTIEFIEAEFDSGIPKIVLFAHHRQVIAQMEQGLAKYNPVVITGDTSSTKRQAAIDNFQTDPNVRLFIGQLGATNSAITLTASDQAIIMEASFVPSDNQQAAARCHRLGQKSSCVNARFIVLGGSVDELVVNIIARKTRHISELLD
jgi:SWI/SNF-related matrix-associated actin-dependent regulator of chromatin subfamily A-like protein 1